MIIDKTNPDHKRFPDSLGGEVLLEDTYDDQGKHSGWHTATQTFCDQMRRATPAERAQYDFDRHQAVLDALPEVLPLSKFVP